MESTHDEPVTGTSQKRQKTVHVDPDSGRADDGRQQERQVLDKTVRDKVLAGLLACHIQLLPKLELPLEALTDIHMSTQMTSAIYTSHTVLRQQANGRGNVQSKVEGKIIKFKSGRFDSEIDFECLTDLVKKAMKCFGFEYTKPGPNETNHWFGVAAPILSFMAGFKYRFDELRVGQASFSIGKEGDATKVVKLSKWGLNTNHHSLCEGITFPPNKQSSIAQSLGPLTGLIKLTLSTDALYQQKWVNAVMRTCAHVPEIATICSMIKGKGAFETKGLICAIGNLLLLISGRQAHRAFMPAGALIMSLMNPNDVNFMYSNSCVDYPGFDYSRISRFNFSGQASFVAYNRLSAMSCPSVLGKHAAQIFFHAVWGTYCEDLGVLEWMTQTSGEWANRAELGDCFRAYGTCNDTLNFQTIKFRYFSKLCSASNSGLLGRREQQTVNSYVFAGKREQKFCTTFLASLKEANQNPTAVRKDIPSLTKMIQETTNKLIELIRKKNRIIEMGTVEWRRMPKNEEDEAEVISERCAGSGRYFLGSATEEEFLDD